MVTNATTTYIFYNQENELPFSTRKFYQRINWGKVQDGKFGEKITACCGRTNDIIIDTKVTLSAKTNFTRWAIRGQRTQCASLVVKLCIADRNEIYETQKWVGKNMILHLETLVGDELERLAAIHLGGDGLLLGLGDAPLLL